MPMYGQASADLRTFILSRRRPRPRTPPPSSAPARTHPTLVHALVVIFVIIAIGACLHVCLFFVLPAVATRRVGARSTA